TEVRQHDRRSRRDRRIPKRPRENGAVPSVVDRGGAVDVRCVAATGVPDSDLTRDGVVVVGGAKLQRGDLIVERRGAADLVDERLVHAFLNIPVVGPDEGWPRGDTHLQ